MLEMCGRFRASKKVATQGRLRGNLARAPETLSLLRNSEMWEKSPEHLPCQDLPEPLRLKQTSHRWSSRFRGMCFALPQMDVGTADCTFQLHRHATLITESPTTPVELLGPCTTPVFPFPAGRVQLLWWQSLPIAAEGQTQHSHKTDFLLGARMLS